MTLKERAFQQLRQWILTGELKPGDFLTEIKLVDMLGMSRTPIRSALERLDAEGLAKYTPNKGLIVAEISIKKAMDLFDYRTALECYVVRKLSVASWREEEARWFEANLLNQERHMRDGDYASFTMADSEFHRRLAKATENEVIAQALEQLQDKLYQVALGVLRKDRLRIQDSYADHQRIYLLVREGRGDEAAAAMERHLEYGKRIMIQ